MSKFLLNITKINLITHKQYLTNASISQADRTSRTNNKLFLTSLIFIVRLVQEGRGYSQHCQYKKKMPQFISLVPLINAQGGIITKIDRRTQGKKRKRIHLERRGV